MKNKKTTLSDIQAARNIEGLRWERRLISLTSGWEKVTEPVDDLVISKTWTADLVNHQKKIYLEATTRAKYEKVSNIRIEARTYKYHYPNYKFVVGIKSFGDDERKSDGLCAVFDHLVQIKNIDQVLVGEEEVLKFMNKPFYEQNINNKTKGVIMNNNTIVMDTILYGAELGKSNAVLKLVDIFSGKQPTTSSSKSKGTKEAMMRKREYFMTNLDEGVLTEPTQSICKVLTKMGKTGDAVRDLNRFFSSKEATMMMDGGVKMIDTEVGNQPDRYHFRLSDVEEYVPTIL